MRWVFVIFLLMVGASLSAGQALADAYLTIETQAGERHSFHVELAQNTETQRRGLMFRDQIADDRGMLFIFDKLDYVHFWMRNTLIPLDMIFIRDGLIDQIETRRDTQSDRATSSQRPVDSVLEINAGLAAAMGLGRGDRVSLQHCEAPCLTP
jgi:uncharacterized membrane protein (UPF0127 family)